MIKLIFAGDYCVRFGGVNNLTPDKTEAVTAPIRKQNEACDFSIINVETVFTDHPTPVKKSGPALSSPLKALEMLEKMKFNGAALANNHTCDQGEKSGLLSQKLIEEAGMTTLGFGKNLKEASKALHFERKNKKFTVLNFAESEFSAATHESFGFAPIDYYENAKQIQKEKERSDFVFVMLHAGSEFCPVPSTELRKFTHHLVDAGADGVIISHPHTVSGYEYYRKKPIVYSVGNFFMSGRSRELSLWNLGYMAEINIRPDDSVTVTPIPYEFDSDGAYFSFLDGEKKEKALSYIQRLSELITSANESDYRSLDYAWSILYMEKAWNGFLKEMLRDTSYDGELMLFIKNAFSCETHRNVLKRFFDVYTTGQINNFEEYKQKLKGYMCLPY